MRKRIPCLKEEQLARQLAVRLSAEDMKHLSVIKSRYGVKADAEAIRIAIRETTKKIQNEASK